MTPAEERADALLRSHLNEKQCAEYDKFGTFHVIGQSGRCYCIYPKMHGNIQVLDRPWGTPLANLCIHPSDESVPVQDSMLAQKLMIECDESTLYGIANRAAYRDSMPDLMLDRFMASEDGREHLARGDIHYNVKLRCILPGRDGAVRFLRECLYPINAHPDLPDLLERIEWPEGSEPATADELFPA